MCPQEQPRSVRLSGFQKNLANGPHCSWSSNPGESTWRSETRTRPETSEAVMRRSQAVFLTWEFSLVPLTVLSSYSCIKGKKAGQHAVWTPLSLNLRTKFLVGEEVKTLKESLQCLFQRHFWIIAPLNSLGVQIMGKLTQGCLRAQQRMYSGYHWEH